MKRNAKSSSCRSVSIRDVLIASAICIAIVACSREEPAQSTKSLVEHVDSITEVYAKYGCLGSLDNPAVITIEKLLASPTMYEGKAVRIEGFYYSSEEHAAIYPDIQDGATSNTRAGLWVLEGLPQQTVGQRVTVEGIFTSRTRGHLGQWPGTICNARVVKAPHL